MKGNPYVEGKRDQNHHTNEGLTQATYTLAYEQRTATLVALLQTPTMEGEDGSTWGIQTGLREDLFNEVMHRLGQAK